MRPIGMTFAVSLSTTALQLLEPGYFHMAFLYWSDADDPDGVCLAGSCYSITAYQDMASRNPVLAERLEQYVKKNETQ